ncbi:transmembrane protein 244 [Fukomys damarensis]|uniref:transmembrane protein 244 n=1 Tax=Fukomys damarensis TaxID=885580 RepID=UPI00145582D3|nr:transmembrane protein 244 [Fukomys damarensis]
MSLLFPSQVVLPNPVLCVFLFYTVHYMSLGLCSLTSKVYESEVLAPFDFKTNPSWLDMNYKVLLFSTEVTYLFCGLLFALVIEEWVWDYAISVMIFHVVITSSVMLEFPSTSHRWAALVLQVWKLTCTERDNLVEFLQPLRWVPFPAFPSAVDCRTQLLLCTNPEAMTAKTWWLQSWSPGGFQLEDTRIWLNFNMWRPDFSILLVQGQLYLPRSG